jgi:hypothetical protein
MTNCLTVSTTKPVCLFGLILIVVTGAYFFIVGNTIFLYVLIAAIFFILAKYGGYKYQFSDVGIIVSRFSNVIAKYEYTDIASCAFIENQAKLKVCLKNGKSLFRSSIILDNDRREIFNYLKKKGVPIPK